MLAGTVDAFSVALQTNPPHDFFTINAGSISVFKPPHDFFTINAGSISVFKIINDKRQCNERFTRSAINNSASVQN